MESIERPLAGADYPQAFRALEEWFRNDESCRLGQQAAAVDRLVHRATILSMNVESFRRREALERKRGPSRPPIRATVKTST